MFVRFLNFLLLSDFHFALLLERFISSPPAPLCEQWGCGGSEGSEARRCRTFAFLCRSSAVVLLELLAQWRAEKLGPNMPSHDKSSKSNKTFSRGHRSSYGSTRDARLAKRARRERSSMTCELCRWFKNHGRWVQVREVGGIYVPLRNAAPGGGLLEGDGDAERPVHSTRWRQVQCTNHSLKHNKRHCNPEVLATLSKRGRKSKLESAENHNSHTITALFQVVCLLSCLLLAFAGAGGIADRGV